MRKKAIGKNFRQDIIKSVPKFLLFKSNAAKDYRQILPLPGEGIDSNVGNLTSRIGEGCRIIKWGCIEKRKAGKMEGPSNKTAKA